MEIQKIRIKRPPSSGLTPTYGSIPCSGGTNYWPINTSYDCSGITMYNSTYSMVDQALSGDMSTFPQELRDCSVTNPCVILWVTIYRPHNNRFYGMFKFRWTSLYAFYGVKIYLS